MESCRGGIDDLSDPEFAELAEQLADDPQLRVHFQRLQEADGAIRQCMSKVPIPDGLADRVARSLAAANPTGAPMPPPLVVTPLAVSPATSPDSPAPLLDKSPRFSRRRLVIGFAALAAAAALLVAVWVQPHPARHDTPTSVLEEAMEYFGRDNQHQGELVSQKVPPAEYPLSRDIRALPDVRWRFVENFLGGMALAYDLPPLPQVGGRATLYVLKRTVVDLTNLPPPTPKSTGGQSAAAWQTGGILYVLVVEGDARVYGSYLDQSHGPLT